METGGVGATMGGRGGGGGAFGFHPLGQHGHVESRGCEDSKESLLQLHLATAEDRCKGSAEAEVFFWFFLTTWRLRRVP